MKSLIFWDFWPLPPPYHPFYYISLWSNVTFWQIPLPPRWVIVIYGRPLFSNSQFILLLDNFSHEYIISYLFQENGVDGDDVNWHIVNPTTSAQYFHLLRRQVQFLIHFWILGTFIWECIIRYTVYFPVFLKRCKFLPKRHFKRKLLTFPFYRIIWWM